MAARALRRAPNAVLAAIWDDVFGSGEVVGGRRKSEVCWLLGRVREAFALSESYGSFDWGIERRPSGLSLSSSSHSSPRI